MQRETVLGSDRFGGGVIGRPNIHDRARIGGHWSLEHYRPINDRELRRACRITAMEGELALLSGPAAERMLAAIAAEGPVKRELIGTDRWRNLIVNVGLDHILDIVLSGGTQITSWFVGLKDTGAPAAGDTMASHAGWATITPYSNATDPAWTDGGVSAQSVDNSASKASFSINATDTIFGAFLKDNNTKGGATGLLYAAGDFASSRAVENGDTLEVTATFTSADDGV